jgi:hypothetical protein
MTVDAPQDVRVDAARLAAQVLAGSGADVHRVSTLFWAFVMMMSPQPIVPVTVATPGANNVLAFAPAPGDKPAGDAA